MSHTFRSLFKKILKFFIAGLNRALKIFHQTMAYLKQRPRIRLTVIALATTATIFAAGYEGRRRWNLAQENKGHHEEDIVHRSEEDLAKYGVTFENTAAGKLAVELKVPGEVKLNGDMVAHMIPRFPGIVRQVLKNLGDTVKKGDVLAILENNANLAPFDMRSQLDGVIIEKNLAVGEVIGSSDEAFVVADLAQVWVDLFIYPSDLPKIKSGQKVRVIDQTSGRQSDGTIAYVAPTISEHTRTALARVVLQNIDMLWRPGTFVTGAILIDESEVPLLVDGASLEDMAGVPTVFVKKDNTFIATPVRVGRRDDRHIEILDGIPAGARIATSGSFLLKSELTKGSASEHQD